MLMGIQLRRNLRVKLEAIPRHDLETFYKAAHKACRYVLRLPSPRLIQELVQAWRALPRRSFIADGTSARLAFPAKWIASRIAAPR